MGISRTEVSTLNKSLREKGLRPRRQRLSARRAVKSRARRAASDDTSLDVATRKHFGTHLRTMRTSHGLTQAALANGAFTAAFVSMIESGSASPSMKSLVHFARRLGVPLREVIPPDL
jgi:ribosome-binding protein aMBF1 (putative translation factor)